MSQEVAQAEKPRMKADTKPKDDNLKHEATSEQESLGYLDTKTDEVCSDEGHEQSTGLSEAADKPKTKADKEQQRKLNMLEIDKEKLSEQLEQRTLQLAELSEKLEKQATGKQEMSNNMATKLGYSQYLTHICLKFHFQLDVIVTFVYNSSLKINAIRYTLCCKCLGSFAFL